LSSELPKPNKSAIENRNFTMFLRKRPTLHFTVVEAGYVWMQSNENVLQHPIFLLKPIVFNRGILPCGAGHKIQSFHIYKDIIGKRFDRPTTIGKHFPLTVISSIL
jgi:hypothetical protein